MKANREKILRLVFEAVDEFNEISLPEVQVEKSEGAVLYGKGGRLDSLGLVSFVVSVEQKVQDAFEAPISLTDEKAMSYKNSPFRSLGSMVDYILHALNNPDA